MDEISVRQDEISKLSDNELSDRLVMLGLSRTPVTNMTRKYLEKQLLTKLGVSSQKWHVDEIGNETPLNGRVRLEDLYEMTSDVTNTKLENENNKSKSERVTLFFAVFCPGDNSGTESMVFYEQEEALKHAKKNKKSRFKAFKAYDEALNFASNGVHPVSSASTPVNPQPISIADGASRFKGPKSQDLVLLRKAIENGNVAQVRRMVWENPRYLVSSGDTPSILQEGARYNALHVAAKVMNAEMTALLLETVSDVNFIQLLYGMESEENCPQRANFLLDLYINTPDKAQNDTPLHIAVKFGAAKVVEVLVSYPECDRCRPNKYLKTPQQVICERVKTLSKSVYDDIELLLRDAYFVPVLRSVDAVLQPKIGDTFSAKKPLVTNNDPMSPQMDVTAYAGPMDLEQAETFRRRWKTPPRVRIPLSFSVARLNDLDRGLEREGRELAKQYSIKWKEYWPFLGIFTDFSTNEGISKLESHLKEKFEKMSQELAVKALELSEPVLTPKVNSEGPLSGGSQALSPMSDLCVSFTSCSLIDKTPPIRTQSHLTSLPASQDTTTSLSPILYIEKTCHVLARRLSDGIYYALQGSDDTLCLSASLKDCLHTEVVNMQKLMNSFRSNSSFSNINFRLIHSRISMLIPHFLDEITQSYDLMRICSGLQLLASKCSQDESSDEEDKNLSSYRGPARAAPLRMGEQVACLSQLVIQSLNRPGGRALAVVEGETQVVAMWARCSECSCVWSSSPPMTRAMRKGSSLKRGFSSGSRLWSRHEAEQVVQNLPVDEDDQSETSETEEAKADEDCVSVEGDGDSFFTPPSSINSDESDIEDFESPEEGFPVFLDGKFPTKLDVDVHRALNFDLVSSDSFPNVWRWRHQLMQFSEQERECWPSPARALLSSPGSPMSPGSHSPVSSPLTHRKPHSLQKMWGSPEPPFTSPKRRLEL